MNEKAFDEVREAIINASSPRTLEEVIETSEREELKTREGELEYVR